MNRFSNKNMDDTIITTWKRRSTKDLAIFDFDGTIVKPKDGRRFPKDVDDWQYVRDSVPTILRKYAKTHQIVIVTDQSKLWKLDQINNVMKDVNLHFTAIIGGKTKKPNTSLFESRFKEFDKGHAFYVGDAGGRHDDWSDVDKKFAENIGVRFLAPEEVFPLGVIPVKPVTETLESKEKEVVIMVGYPASGKSTIAKSLKGYYRVDGDLLGTAPKMVKDAKAHLDQSIVFDSTAGTKERRAAYVKFAKENGLPVRVFWVQTPIDVAMERNKQRALEGGTKVPDIVFYVYRKKFEEPHESEGFAVVKF